METEIETGIGKVTKLVVIALLTVAVFIFVGSFTHLILFPIIGTVILICVYAFLAGTNPTEESNKLQWLYYGLAVVMLMFTVVSFIRNETFVQQIGMASNYMPFCGYFLCFKPSKIGIGSKILKFIGYYMIPSCLSVSYTFNPGNAMDCIMLAVLCLIGVLFLYLGNRSYLNGNKKAS